MTHAAKNVVNIFHQGVGIRRAHHKQAIVFQCPMDFVQKLKGLLQVFDYMGKDDNVKLLIWKSFGI